MDLISMIFYYLFAIIISVQNSGLVNFITEKVVFYAKMNEQTWTVVQFIDDGTVEAVPSIWIQGEKCHWPTFSQQKLLNAIRKYEPLNTCWPCHNVRIFRKATFDDYLKARNKARLAEETSDLNTEEESIAAKRKIIQKKISSSDSSMSESLLPSPPKMKKTHKITKQKICSSTLNALENPSGTKENDDFDTTLDDTANNSSYFNNENIAHNAQNLDIINISTAQVGCHSCEETEKHLKTIIQQNHMLRTLMTDVLAEIKNVKEVYKASKLEKKVESSFYTKFPEIQFPISTDEQLQALEVILTNEDEYNNGVLELSKLGGSNNYNFVKRALSSLLSDEIAIKYSWLGRKAKKDFHNLLLAKLIISSAEAARMAASAKETETSIQGWLRRASERKNNVIKKM